MGRNKMVTVTTILAFVISLFRAVKCIHTVDKTVLLGTNATLYCDNVNPSSPVTWIVKNSYE